MTTARDSAQVRWTIATLALPMLMASLDTSIANTALPTLATTFAASFAAVQWIVLAYLLAITTVIVSVGRLGDLLGRRRMLMVGIWAFTVASLACGLAPTLSVLIAARAVQGLGAATMMALALAAIGESIPTARTGRVMGLLGAMSAVGTALGPSLGGLCLAGPGWRTIFLLNVPIGLVNLILVHRHLPADQVRPDAAPPGLDLPGTLALAGTLAAYALAMTVPGAPLGRTSVLLLLAALAGLMVFVRVEMRAASPLVRLTLLREHGLSTSLVLGTMVSAVIMSTLVVGPFYLSRALQLRPALVGLLLSVGPVVAALSGLPAGRLVDRFGTTPTTRAGLVGIAFGSLALCLVPMRWGALGYVLPIAVLTAHYALFQTANNSAALGGIDTAHRGVVAGLLNLARNLGLITGTSVLGAVFALGSHSTSMPLASPEAIATGMRATFATATALILFALSLSLAGLTDRRRAPVPEPAG